MDSIDDLYFLDSPFLKFLLLSERRKQVNDIFNSRTRFGEFHTLFEELKKQPDKFYEYFRMSPQTFFYILDGIEECISKQSNFGPCIPAEERLAVTLRFLSTGLSFRSLSFSYRISHCTIRKIVYETCLSIWNCFHERHMPVSKTSDLKKIAEDYFTRWNFPNCIGSIDGKHIRIKCPEHSGSLYYNYKQYFSIVLQGIADANYKFITIDVGAYGKQSDGGIFSVSNVYKKLENNTFNVPQDSYLPSTEVLAPYVLLGDEAYPLKTYLLKPYSRQNLTDEEENYNYRLSRARRCIECAFGILVAKWRVLETELQVHPRNVDAIVQCVCLLHNIIIDKDGIPTFDTVFTRENGLSVSRHYNHSATRAVAAREIYKNYFSQHSM